MATDLRTLRRTLKTRRRLLPLPEQHAHARQAVHHLLGTRLFRAARNIAIYLPVRGEISPLALRLHANPRQRFYLPVLSPCRQQGLLFLHWHSATRFRANRYRIDEPRLQYSHLLPARQLDLVITPLLGFDAAGNRLGMGGGYYDRSFAFKSRLTAHSRPFLLGFAYAFQQVEALPYRPWDIPLNGVVTERGLKAFNRS